MIEIKNCPATLLPGHGTYSRAGLKKLFGGTKVSHLLPYPSPFAADGVDRQFLLNRQSVSLSGVQGKFSLIRDGHGMRLATPDEQGTHILKPAPQKIAGLTKNEEHLPANEHLTMQIAEQVYKIDTAHSAMIFFGDGTPAYLVKRFDLGPGNFKYAQEDFASLLAKTKRSHGADFKYTGSYADLFQAMRGKVAAYPVEALKLFRIIVFNYLFSNGDAHLKNFSLLETPDGDYALSPAYDLLNTRIHVDDKDLALDQGLLPKDPGGSLRIKLLKLADIADLSPKAVAKTLKQMSAPYDKTEVLINRSFLSEKLKRNYLQTYRRRLKTLQKT
ncbi:hypothetical protein FUAX_53360 (plasmid) [Fulvitalea axinellae]|uniref:HipA-like C-terminal domain-containing protein n=1 Tax=Fulvitalea axinellae TaxID=1182444 RepID=A0AAU9DEN8_9BACT|nr:hypothetical protein FUAX_53360 [Fulvitalea axinellae]